MVVKVEDAETKRNKACVEPTGWNKREKATATTPKRSVCVQVACNYFFNRKFANQRAIVEQKNQSKQKRRGHPPEKRENNAEDYPSANACHLAANKECSLTYDDSDFKVLARCRSKHHLNILEAIYIHVLKIVLCKQKSFVASLTLDKPAHRTRSHQERERERERESEKTILKKENITWSAVKVAMNSDGDGWTKTCEEKKVEKLRNTMWGERGRQK